MNKTFAHILEIGCSGLFGVIITLTYQHFFSYPIVVNINGQEVAVTKSNYTDLVTENELLSMELLNAQDEIKKLQDTLNDENDTESSPKYDISLTSLDYFSRSGNVQTDYAFDNTDNYDIVYPSCITPFDDDEVFIEYNLSGNEYTNLSGTLYVTRRARFINPEYFTWNIATFTIYGDDIPLYTHTGFTTKDEPLPIDVDITGVKFLKIYFKDAHYYDTGMSESLIGFGNPTLK